MVVRWTLVGDAGLAQAATPQELVDLDPPPRCWWTWTYTHPQELLDLDPWPQELVNLVPTPTPTPRSWEELDFTSQDGGDTPTACV